MAAPISKRRKLEHDTSDEDEDGASFASFGSSDHDDGDVEEPAANGGAMHVDDDELEDFDGDGQDEMENRHTAAAPKKAAAKPGKQDQPKARGQPNAKHTPAQGNSVPMSGTFKSNMFKIQVDDLLDQIRPKRSKREVAAEEALHKLKATIEKIPARESLSVEDADRQLLKSNKVVVPFPDPRPPKDAKYKLEYKSPTSINVVGSYALKTASRAKEILDIDMTVMMPSSLFQEKDYSNYRYFYKRAYYLACVAAGLQKAHGEEYRLLFSHWHNNAFKAVLQILPAQRDEKQAKWRINVIPCIAPEAFAPSKLLLDRNCIRSSEADVVQVATPFYNSSIRSDMLVTSYLKLLHAASKRCSAFLDACLLGSTWLRQRGLGSDIHAGGFGHFELTALMALLLEAGGSTGRPILSEGYSSYQLWKATLQLLALKDTAKETFVIGSNEGIAKPTTLNLPVIWDGERKHNLLFKMTSWSYNALRLECRSTLTMLSDQSFDGFDACFISRSDLSMHRYDYAMKVTASSIGKKSLRQGNSPLPDCTKLYDILARALGDRVNLINIIPSFKDWEIGFARPDRDTEDKLFVGFAVNPNNISRTVDRGPSAENKSEAAVFREFWGEKAELRRFNDGSILETLTWPGDSRTPSIFEQIIRYAIKKHVGEDAEQETKLVGDGFKKMLVRSMSALGSQQLHAAYKVLENDIRTLDNLPLSIRQIAPADSQLRHASPAVSNTAPADVVIQFEGSARWPDDLVAIQRTKIAFLLNLSGLLQASVEGIISRIGLENQEYDIFNQAFLDIVYESGAAFRLRIHHDREQTLLERKLKDKTLDPRAKEIAATGLAMYKRDYIKSPAFTQAISRLCNRYPSLSGTIKLLKKWFGSHLLSSHIADEIIEMFAARIFLQPWPWQTPSSVQSAFLRTLAWLSRWDWRNEPLVVDLSGSDELKQADIQAIYTKYEAWRKLDPLLNRVVFFCASNIDPDGTTWTNVRPQKVVAARMTALAKAACAEIENKQFLLEPAALFSSPLTDFDFVLHLEPHFVDGKALRKRAGRDGGTAFKNLELDVGGDASMKGYEPARQFLEELERLFGNAVLLFSGGRERPVVGGLWNPQTAPRTWRLNLAYSTATERRAGDEDVQVRINKEGILAEMARLGGDMVGKIELYR